MITTLFIITQVQLDWVTGDGEGRLEKKKDKKRDGGIVINTLKCLLEHKEMNSVMNNIVLPMYTTVKLLFCFQIYL